MSKPQATNKKLITILIIFGVIVSLLGGIGLYQYFHKKEHGYYSIGIILSSVEVTPQDMDIMKSIIKQKLDNLNKQGGINNRPVKAVYLDDKGDPDKLYQLVQETSRDKNMIAYIGSKGTTRAQKIGPLLAQKNIPYIARYVMTNLMKRYPNAYSSEIDFKDLMVVFRDMLLQKSKNAAFIGMSGDIYTAALLQEMDKLAYENPEFRIPVIKWYELEHKFSQQEFDMLADSLRQSADFLVLSAEPKLVNTVLQNLWKRGVNIPVYCGLTDILQLDVNNPNYLAAELYDINAFGVPGVQNMRIYEYQENIPDIIALDNSLEFQLGLSGRLVDEIGLIQEAAADKSHPSNLNIREKINRGLQKYVNSEKVYRGAFSDWSFTEDHGFAGQALLSWKPSNYSLPLLFPTQFHFNDSTRKLEPELPVIYANLDLEEISQVNDEDGSFYASFFLDISSAYNLTFKDLDFPNAARNKINQEALVEAKLIRSRVDSNTQTFHSYLYKVSGKFFFNPKLKQYPFDVQKFPIRVQPKNDLQPFLVQPPNEVLRDTLFRSVGWIYKQSFVGFNQETITIENDFSNLQRNITTYNFSYVYIMKRAKVDFTLKILVPLLALLTISYFSVYIPRKEFEAMCGIQVTALLSAIALYFATYKPEMQYATTSDKIFIFTYIMITSLIGTSIYRYIRYHFKSFYSQTAHIYQILIFPIIVIAFTLIIS